MLDPFWSEKVESVVARVAPIESYTPREAGGLTVKGSLKDCHDAGADQTRSDFSNLI